MKNYLAQFVLIRLACLLSLTAIANSQQPEIEFNHIKLPGGISNLTVYAILRDQQGYMWFASDDGAYRYDGYDFRLFQEQPGDSAGPIGNLIHAILQDNQGYLWFGTIKGLSRYNPVDGKFTHFQSSPQDMHSLAGNEIYGLHEDRTGRLWVASWGGLSLFDRQTETFRRFMQTTDSADGLPGNRVMNVYQDDSGTIWVATLSGLCAMTEHEGGIWQFVHFRSIPGDPHSLYGNSVYWIHGDRHNRLWVGTHSGFAEILRPSPGVNDVTFRRILPQLYEAGEDEICYKIAEDLKGNLWISSWGRGLVRYHPQSGNLQRYRQSGAKPHSLNDNTIQSLYVNPDSAVGALWVGTLRGIDVHFPHKRKFQLVQHDPQNPLSLSDNHVHSILEDSNGDLWIGTMRGLSRSSGGAGEFRHYHSGNSGLSADLILSLFEDSSGEIWVGSFEGLHRYDRSKDAFFQDEPLIEIDERILRVFAFCEDDQGNIWLGTRHGLIRYTKSDNSVKKFDQDGNNNQSLPNSNVQALLIDRAGHFWVGTTGGLAIFDTADETFYHFPSAGEQAGGLGNPVVRAIHQDTQGNIWIATDGGLNELLTNNSTDPVQWHFRTFTTDDGLPANHISGILEDDAGTFWLPTSRGLSRFDIQQENFHNYDVSDGLQSSDFTTAAYIRARDGQLMFGGINGLNIFDPDSIRDNPHVPPVVFTEFHVFDRPVEFHANLNHLQEIQLEHRQDFFSFRFSALDFTQPEKNRYAYQMKGFDNNWVYSGIRRYASYTNLDPGSYVFRVKGTNNDGIWNEKGASIRIIIHPPFWQRWWFRLLILILLAMALYTLHRYRIRRINEMQAIRAGIAADLHDEVSSSLASVKLYAQFVAKQLPAGEHESRELLNRIGILSAEAIDGIRQIIWSIDPRHDGLRELVNDLTARAAALFNAAGIDYQHSADSIPDNIKIPPQTRRAVYLIFKEANNNIIRHSQAANVKFSVAANKDHWIFTLEDDGSGFYETDNSGQGIKNMRNRARQIGAELLIDSNQGKGTLIRLRLSLA